MCRRLVAAAFLVLALASTPGAAQQTSAASVGPAYRIHPGDEIEIMVWGDARLQRTYEYCRTVRSPSRWPGKSWPAASCPRILNASSRRLSGPSTGEQSHK